MIRRGVRFVVSGLRLLSLLACLGTAWLGLCARCGYDLRESPERWPECGAVPPGGEPRAV